MGIKRYIRAAALVSLLAAVVAWSASCAPSKAIMDYTMTESIVWPGGKEKPRIKFLWTLQRLAGGEETQFERFIGGELDHAIGDPRNSALLINPHGVFVDGNDRMYIADPGAFRVSVVDLKTTETFQILYAGVEPLQFPLGVVADPEGRIYVTDPEMRKVVVFDKDGKFLYFFEGSFKRPTGIAVDIKRKVVYVTDTWDHKIFKYNYGGQRLAVIGKRGEGHGEFNYPTHLAIAPDGALNVSDTMNFRVQILSPEGKYINSFGVAGDTFDTFDKIKGIAVDTEGHIYVVDSKQDTVRIYNREGRLLLFFGNTGRFYGEFTLPTGIYIDSKDRIFVSDSWNMRIQTFQFLGGN